jgi:DNA-binding NarL/FixJ family response regulator
MIRLLIADDHAIVRTGLKQIFALVPDFEVVGEAENGGEVLERLRQGGVDLLLLDLDMPGVSGADLIARVKTHWPTLPILVLSMHNEAHVAVRALKAGAAGYITKDCNLDILLPAIRTVAFKGKFIAPGMAEKMVFYEIPSPQGAPHLLLTEREAEIFRLLTEGLSVNNIATRMAISNKTVSTHKARLMAKMDLTSLADLMRYAMQHDLLG